MGNFISYVLGVIVGIIISTYLFYNHAITYKEAISHKCGEYNSSTGKFQFLYK